MADEEDKEAEKSEAAAPKKGKSKKLILALILLPVLLLAIGVPVFFLLRGAKPAEVQTAHVQLDTDAEAVPEGADDEEQLDENEEPLGAFFPLDTFIVNLSKGGYIRTSVQIEFEDREVPRRFITRLVPIRDGVIGILASRTSDECTSSEGKSNLKQDIKALVNEHLRKEAVRNVYFTQFVVQ